MANPHKGEVGFTAGTGSYRLSFSADALVELETALDMTVNQISEMMQNPKQFRVGMLRTMFWAGLLDSHEGKMDMTQARAIFRLLSVNEVIELIGKAFTLTFPASADSASDPPPKPVEPAAGTGPIS